MLLILSFCAGMTWILHTARQEAAKDICTEVKICFTENLEFVTEKEIRNYVASEYGSCVGKRLEDIDLAFLEQMLESKTAVRNAEAWTNRDGILNICISQRVPKLRFYNDGKGFYVDGQGYVFPLHKDYTAPVTTIYGPVPTGIPEGYRGEAEDEEVRNWITRVLSLCNYMEDSDIWKDRIKTISLTENRDIVLHTDDTETAFLFGDPAGFEGKLLKMEKFYSHILPVKGEGYYKSVNLKFKNQMICRKDI